MNLVTGATGFLGSHIVETLLEQGQQVRVLVRPSSDTRRLDRMPVHKVVGDLSEPTCLEAACRDIEVVYHAAARVADWGPWSAFRRDTVSAAENLARAALKASVRRFVHISSLSAYGNLNRRGLVVDEASPLNVRTFAWNNYVRSKAMAEEVLWRLFADKGLPLTVIRPGMIYGPRDRTVLPRLHRMLSRGQVKIVGKGDNVASIVFVRNLADACILAAGCEKALGQAYNCIDNDCLTQRQFLGLLADALGCPRPCRAVPYCVALGVGLVCECVGRVFYPRRAPILSRQGVWVIGRPASFLSDKIRRDLGWHPGIGTREAVERTAREYLASQRRGGL